MPERFRFFTETLKRYLSFAGITPVGDLWAVKKVSRFRNVAETKAEDLGGSYSLPRSQP